MWAHSLYPCLTDHVFCELLWERRDTSSLRNAVLELVPEDKGHWFIHFFSLGRIQKRKLLGICQMRQNAVCFDLDYKFCEFRFRQYTFEWRGKVIGFELLIGIKNQSWHIAFVFWCVLVLYFYLGTMLRKSLESEIPAEKIRYKINVIRRGLRVTLCVSFLSL